MVAQDPARLKNGTVRITDPSVFKASKTIAAALVEVDPGGMRELHWHSTNDGLLITGQNPASSTPTAAFLVKQLAEGVRS